MMNMLASGQSDKLSRRERVMSDDQQLTASDLAVWRYNSRCLAIRTGQVLRIELPGPARLGWSSDGWKTIHEATTMDQGFDRHVVELETATLPSNCGVDFTMFWLVRQFWEEIDYHIEVRGID